MFCTFPPCFPWRATSMLQSQVSPSEISPPLSSCPGGSAHPRSAHPAPHAQGNPLLPSLGSTSVKYLLSFLQHFLPFYWLFTCLSSHSPTEGLRIKVLTKNKNTTTKTTNIFSFPFPSTPSPKYSTSLRSGSPQLLSAPSYLKCSSPLPPFLLSS